MTSFIHIFILLPIVGFLISLLIPARKEGIISGVAFGTVGLHLASTIGFLGYWLFNGQPVLNIKDIVLFKSIGYEFFIDFCFDKIAATYLFVGSFLTFLVTIYSRYYLHRESGYKRFFNTILFFYVGYNTAILSGNLETLFIGWEILGISSFLLIAFYRDRYLPVKNAVKVFSIYRIGDVGLILAMWMSHHLFHENITFLKLSNYELVHEHLQSHTWIGVFISVMILISAAAKSAQLPFSSWLPRAMEGPTPSTAIFYGSLSVHLGVFLLLRTYPFWEHQLSVRILIALLGLFTAVITTGIARVQSSVKSQIAYASIAQIGLIFIEVAAGFEMLAMFHFAGNAFLRTYQLLVSPSVVSYLIREQFYNFSPRERSIEDFFPKKLEYTLYTLSVKEWNLDSFMYQYLWNPLKWAGNKMNFLTVNRVLIFFIPTYLIGMISLYYEDMIPANIHVYLPIFFSIIGLLMVLKSFTERKKARMSWILVILNHFWIALSISFNEHFTLDHTFLYLSGIIVAGGLGYICLNTLKSLEGNIDLDQFHGHSYKHPKLAFIFLMACLGVSGFPITPTFIGEDLIFSHIHENQAILAFSISLSFIIDGLAIIRIYARIFLGPHVKSVYETAYRSS
ncbi:proton-conducting transporter membrane subunit [Runella sp.]|uniref:proton-conducting transporter transmembrane domain-containing protein n=1 Tax=Runella sp. TaxID=1960881 RepID=UPI003D0A9CEF